MTYTNENFKRYIRIYIFADIYIQVNGHVMKPLEEYMLFTKSGADNITVINPQGLRSAQCNAKFDVSEQPTQEPMVNVSMVSGKGQRQGKEYSLMTARHSP